MAIDVSSDNVKKYCTRISLIEEKEIYFRHFQFTATKRHYLIDSPSNKLRFNYFVLKYK